MTDIYQLYIVMLVARDKPQDFLGIYICISIYYFYGIWNTFPFAQLIN